MSIFTSLDVSVMMVKRVTSLPVPAVVGIAMMGAAGLAILLSPHEIRDLGRVGG